MSIAPLSVRLKKKTEKELKIELGGESHTLCNLIQFLLSQDENVELAGYNIPHPLISDPVVYVRVKKGDPKEALINVAKEIMHQVNEFRRFWENQVKEGRAQRS